jgi:hypothetical protein
VVGRPKILLLGFPTELGSKSFKSITFSFKNF